MFSIFTKAYLPPTELFKVVSSMQRARMDDQCGLISQTDLELPEFLRLPAKVASKTQHVNSSSKNHTNNNNRHDDDVFPPPPAATSSDDDVVVVDDAFVRGVLPPESASPLLQHQHMRDLSNIPMANFTPPPPLRHQPHT